MVAAFTSVGAYRGTVGMLGGELPHALEALIASGKPVALIALGNPYVLRNFGNVTAYLATFSTVAPSEIAAARAVLGEIDITGRLPVTIPGQAAYGEGIQLRATRPFRPAAPRSKLVHNKRQPSHDSSRKREETLRRGTMSTR